MSTENQINTASLVVSKDTFNEIIQYKHELLINVNDALLHDDHQIVKEYLHMVPSSEVYYYLEFHQKIMINFLYFKDINILKHHMQWSYRVNYFNNIDLDIFLYFFRLWKSSYANYLSSVHLMEINNIYDYLEVEHKNAIELVKNQNVDSSSDSMVQKIYELAINAKKDDIYHELQEHCKTITEFGNFFNDVISKVMDNVGLQWEISKLSVAKEHIASRSIEEACSNIINQYEQEESKDKKILLTNAPNEFHGMGLKILSKLLEKKGYTIIQIGGSGSPSKDICSAIKEFQPNYVLFGISLCTNLYDVAQIITTIKKEIHPFHEIPIIIGGNAFKPLNNPKESLNADHYFEYISDTYSIL